MDLSKNQWRSTRGEATRGQKLPIRVKHFLEPAMLCHLAKGMWISVKCISLFQLKGMQEVSKKGAYGKKNHKNAKK